MAVVNRGHKSGKKIYFHQKKLKNKLKRNLQKHLYLVTLQVPLEVPKEDQAPKPVAPTPEQIIAIKIFILEFRNAEDGFGTAKKGLYSLGMLVWVLDCALTIRNLPQAIKLGTH
ncbi:hypothetical protein HYC85_012884 [Camellia sinensis]|uniref:Uncharacterized protein n=1 Tax=Camellia sinensis TaxID=4442 RepID=A0A7J7HF91_CAMSI|nr:hypothetical protein HYC85_012884 [Camellia sinensis]